MSAEASKAVTQLARQFDDAVLARDALAAQAGQLQASLDAGQSLQSAEARCRLALEEGAALLERECSGLREALEESRRTAATLGATAQASEAHLREQRLVAERAQMEAAEARVQLHKAAEEVATLRGRSLLACSASGLLLLLLLLNYSTYLLWA